MRLKAGLTALVLGSLAAFGNPAHAEGLGAEARAEIAEMREGALPKLMLHETPRAPLEAPFRDPNGFAQSFADHRGKLMVVNLWATWCPPCREEMPSLDRLSAKLSDAPVKVLAIAMEHGGQEKAPAFMEEIGAERLVGYSDETREMGRRTGVLGLPTTLILDPQGREIARYQGDAEWDSPGAVALIRRLAELTGAGAEG
jgi:thiol-disulfide isomerase/thioredoxin